MSGREIGGASALALAVTAVFYLAGAFAAADFNIANWDAEGRVIVALMWTMSVFAGAAIGRELWK